MTEDTVSDVPYDFGTKITELEALLKAKWQTAGTPANKSPATSDSQNALIWIVIMFAALAATGLVCLIRVKKK